MVSDFMKDIFKPYFEAVSKILEGTAVNELDDIRQECNKAYGSNISGKDIVLDKQNYPGGYDATSLTVSFAADAENRILNGTDPVEAYSGKGMEPLNFRERCRKVLKAEVQYYLGNA